MKKALITGATGCIGRNLVEVLLESGDWELYCFHRKSSDLKKLEGCDVNFIEVDLHNEEDIINKFPNSINCVFHLAANVSHWSLDGEKQWKDNVLATKNLVRASIKKEAGRFIFTSTGATSALQGADAEYTTNHEKNGYIRTKRLSEIEVYNAIDEHGLDAVVIQPIITIGAYDYNNYSEIFKQVKAGKMNKATPGRIAFCHAKDVARAHLSAYFNGRCGENYILGGDYEYWLNAYKKISKEVGGCKIKGEWSIFPLFVLAYILQCLSYITRKAPLITPEVVSLLGDAPDVSRQEKRKALEHLNYKSSSLDQAILDCANWLKRTNQI